METESLSADRLGAFGCDRLIVPFLLFMEVRIMKKIGIIMGSDSDLPIIQKAVDVLKSF